MDGDPSPGTVEDQDMKRREAVALAAKISVGAGLTAADRAILDAPVTASPVPTRIGAPDVVRVEAMTRNLMAQDKDLRWRFLPRRRARLSELGAAAAGGERVR